MRTVEKHNQKLLVEGNDDQHVIWALCCKFGVAENFDVIDCEGIEKLFNQIPIRFKQSNIETVGIIIDADTDINNRWESLKHSLSLQGFIMPDEIPNGGFVVENANSKTVGVWIMPNNQLNGKLEDFITFLIPNNDNLIPVVDSTLNHLEEKNLNQYSLIHKSKAKIHTWLSWQEDPGTPMGLAITKRFLTTEDGNCLSLIEWLKRLYS